MILAIVGSRRFEVPHATLYARHVIEHELMASKPQLVISGGAEGIDSIAIEIAERLGYPWKEYLPESRRWEPNGFKARNEAIARDCDELISIRCHASTTYGSGWTADYADNLLRPVTSYVL